jgi:2-keto-4-pentenoate hydratase/2-oxohepta-3-ene-1,7-dioic acid hydratase in catechol pathway
MQLARYRDGNRVAWGFVLGDDVRAAPAGPIGLVEALGLSPQALDELLASADHATPLSEVELLPPISQPSKLVCVGLNYREHAKESGFALPAEPLIFAKFPSSATGANGDVILPPESSQVDWEAELAVVIGRHAEGVEVSDALDYVGGYCVANDVSARDVQVKDGQWVRAKSFTTFCPIGPWVTTRDSVDIAAGLDIQLSINGEVMQHGNTSDLIFDVPSIVSYCSFISALLPGDIILTGTPAGTGVGMNPQRFLVAGDSMSTSIEGLGSLSNTVTRRI